LDTLSAKDRHAWRLWLEHNNAAEKEVWLLFYRKHAGRPSVSYDEAVEEALCFGWIDSVVRRVDDDSYAQKFTPRKTGSKWSSSNLSRMKKLIDEARVAPSGMEVYRKRSSERPEAEKLKDAPLTVPQDFEMSIRKNAIAWKNFQDFPPAERNTCCGS
jgi:uncharacterized protein YdeI (YjbR/CyaY-like superfamily)